MKMQTGLKMKWQVPLLMCLAMSSALAQPDKDDKVPYYININRTGKENIQTLYDYRLNVEYTDAHGKKPNVALRIYDWRLALVATMQMDKAFGQNNYTIKLDKLPVTWELNKVYYAELKEDNENMLKFPFRIIIPEGGNMDISILSNPLEVGCKELSNSVVEFYGMITGGKAPYQVSWYVLNATRTDFLYQPMQQEVEISGRTPMIIVDKNPEYFVVVYVLDACGNEKKRTVNMVCDQSQAKINTLFVEELPIDNFKKKKSIQ